MLGLDNGHTYTLDRTFARFAGRSASVPSGDCKLISGPEGMSQNKTRHEDAPLSGNHTTCAHFVRPLSPQCTAATDVCHAEKPCLFGGDLHRGRAFRARFRAHACVPRRLCGKSTPAFVSMLRREMPSGPRLHSRLRMFAFTSTLRSHSTARVSSKWTTLLRNQP